jgi:spore germination protein YaaH/putative cell wall-binding protein
MKRTSHAIVGIALLVILALPAGAAAADPPLGGAVTLADGSVLPPMPAGLVTPSAQSEMLAAHGGGTTAVSGSGGKASVGSVDPLAGETAAITGLVGALPNGLGHEVLGFLPYWDLDAAVVSRLRLDLLSTIAYFSVGVSQNGALQKTTTGGAATVGWAGWTSPTLTSLMNAAHQRGVRVVPTITMHAWSYDFTAMTGLLNSTANRANLVNGVVAMVRDRHADGVNVDFEPVPSSLRAAFTSFTRQLKSGLMSAGVGSYLTVDTMAGAAAWASGYDVAALAAPGAADAIMVMAYDFSYAGSARAGGVAPYGSSTIYAAGDALRDHLAAVPPSRLIWGVPYYGRAWNTSSDQVNSPVRSPVSSSAFAYFRTDVAGNYARSLATTNGRHWDTLGQGPYTIYRASDGGWRQLYYDDPTSIGLKYDLVVRNGLAGTGIWALGMDTGTSDLWNVIESHLLERVGRASGADRYGTAAAVSSGAYGTGVAVAYLATGADFADALAAGPAAGRLGGPVLLAKRTVLPDATVSELLRLAPQRIVVLGGPSVIADSLMTSLQAYASGGGVSRLGGSDRFGTAAAVSADAFPGGAPVVYLASGASFADALSGGVAAGRAGGPILLTAADRLPDATAAELARLDPAEIVILGGPAMISAAVADALATLAPSATVTRLSGANRYATSIAVSKATTAPGPRVVYLATGQGYPDGLAGSPPAVRDDGPLLLTSTVAIPPDVLAELQRLNPARVVILGGTASISAAIATQLRALWD